MTVIESLQLLLIAILCVITSITDIQGGKIQNRHLVFVFVPATMLNVIYYGFFARQLGIAFLINILVMSLVSVLLYTYRIWAAGDSKLLIIVAYLLPARIYYPYETSLSPTIGIIIFVFSIAFIFVLAESIVLGIKQRNMLSIAHIKMNLVSFLGQYLLCTLYLLLFHAVMLLPGINYFARNNVLLIMFANMLLILSVLKIKVFKNKYVISVSIILTVGLGAVEKFSVFKSIDFSVLLFSVLIICLRMLAEKYNYKIVGTEQIKEGMVLSWASIALFMPSRIAGLPESTTEDMESRLTAQQAENIRRWSGSKYGQKELSIVRKLPFAIFISIGTLIYSIVRFVNYGQ